MNPPPEIILQDACYYATPEYAASFWGKYVWLYQGKGQLKLTAKALLLEDKLQLLEIPHVAVTNIAIGRFSRLSKPFTLAHIVVRFRQADYERRLLLIPVKSGFAPTWETNKVIGKWIERLEQIAELSQHIQQPVQVPGPPTLLEIGAFIAVILLVWGGVGVATIFGIQLFLR